MARLPEELPVILMLCLELGAWGANRCWRAASRPSNCWRRRWCCASIKQAPRPATACGCAACGRKGRATRAARRRQAFDPMEGAIGAAGARLPENTEHLHADWALIDDYPLSRQMLAMSRVWRSPSRQDYVIAAKGASEAIMNLCHLDPAHGARIAVQGGPLTGSELDGMDAAAAVSLLLVVLGVPVLRQLFAFAIPATGPLLPCCPVAATLAGAPCCGVYLPAYPLLPADGPPPLSAYPSRGCMHLLG